MKQSLILRDNRGKFIKGSAYWLGKKRSEETIRKVSLAKTKPKIERVCIACNKTFYVLSSVLKVRSSNFCSGECYRNSKSFKHRQEKYQFKKGQYANEKHPEWKGENVGYSGLHYWVKRYKGKPQKCEHCGSTKKIQWANQSGEYKRKLEDWIALCVPCHRLYDQQVPGRIKERFGENFAVRYA